MGSRTIALTFVSIVSLMSPLHGAPASSQPPVTPASPDFVITRPNDPAAPQPNSTSDVKSPRYVIGPLDTLAITVVGEADLTNKYRVDSDGTITLPYVNRIPAAGLTALELQARIAAALRDGYLQNPQVLIDVDQYKARNVLVVGEVRAPGKVVLTGLTMTLLEALALAGSPTSNAANEVIVVHAPRPGESPSEPISVNRKELELGRAGGEVVLQDGDIINVPVAKRFWIDGFVRNPGTYVLDTGTTVAQAIILAGGLAERGSDRRLSVVRSVNGKIVESPINLGEKVRPDDQIKVGARLF